MISRFTNYSEFMRPTVSTDADLAMLACLLEKQRCIIDKKLHRPAQWRGLMRREIHGHVRPGEKARYVQAYNEFIAEVVSNPQWTLNENTLCAIHDKAVGGADFRDVGMRVGGHHNFPHSAEIPARLNNLLGWASTSQEPASVIATRLHLDLLSIHPFRDGNGRTARLAATLWLVHAGFCSSLFISVEQHFHPNPSAYITLLDRFRFGEIDEEKCIWHLLQTMLNNSMYAAWFRKREEQLHNACATQGIPQDEWEQTLVSYDVDRVPSGWAHLLFQTIGCDEPPLHTLFKNLSSARRIELAFQIERLLDEERDESNLY